MCEFVLVCMSVSVCGHVCSECVNVWMCLLHVCVYVCVYACVRVGVSKIVSVCVSMCMYVHECLCICLCGGAWGFVGVNVFCVFEV